MYKWKSHKIKYIFYHVSLMFIKPHRRYVVRRRTRLGLGLRARKRGIIINTFDILSHCAVVALSETK